MFVSNPRRKLGQLALVLALVELSGCSELGVLLGVRTRLDKLPVTAISASMVDKAGPSPITATPRANMM